MKRSCSFKYHAVCFLLEYLFLLVRTSFTLGSFEPVSESKCEYEDANLMWRNMPTYSLSDVKSMAWYKGKDNLIATWLEGKGFKEYSPYIGRLMQIGETGIKLKKADRSDSGSYWLFLTLASTDHKLEGVTHLEIIVAPSSKCKPNITEEASSLKAELPYEGCGTPSLLPKWKNTSKTAILELQASRLLDLGRNSESGEYVACAEGDSAKCYHGNISDLCTRHSKSYHQRSGDGLTPDPVYIILPIVLVALIAVMAVIWWKRKFCSEASTHDEGYPLIEKGFPAIQNYLRGLYKDMTDVSLSPTGKEKFVDVSEVYIDLDFQQMETRDFKCTENEQAWITSYKPSVSKEAIHIVKAHNQNVSPIIIVGCSGSGKSTWCKHLVQHWIKNSKTEEANVQGINLPNLGKYQILLYLPLKYSDRGLSFQELLQQYLFQGQPEYLNIITKYMYDENHAPSILILIDGFDIISEYVKPMSELLDHMLFSLCTVIFTCRPSSLNLILTARVDSSIQLFKVEEIALEKSTIYASKVLSRFNQQNKDFNIKNFLTFTRNLHVQSLLKLPYLCLMLLFAWMENKNPYIEITDILLRIVEHLLETAKTDHRYKEKIMKLLQRKSSEVCTSVNKLDERFVKIKNLMYELSMTTEEIFLCERKWLTDENRLLGGTPAGGRYTLPLEILHEIGLVSESIPLKATKSQYCLTFTNVLIYQLFVSMAIAFKKGHTFDYIVSDMEVARKNSMIIHMLFQFSPTLGKEVFVQIRNLQSNKLEKPGLGEQTNKFRYSITELSKGDKCCQVNWLQLVMYKSDLDDEKLLFLTNALMSLDSFTSLALENNENKDDLVSWLPCSQTLERLVLNINNCTVLLCPEWNNQIPLKLQEVVIKTINISKEDLEVLCKAFSSCKNIQKLEISTTGVSTGDSEIVSSGQPPKNIYEKYTEHLRKLKFAGEPVDVLFYIDAYESLQTLTTKN